MPSLNILKVDLTKRTCEKQELPESVRMQYIGGLGLAAKLVFDAEAYKHDPLSPENMFVLAVGPLASSLYAGVSRFETAFRSPQTGGIGYASCGGFLTPEFRNTGLDAVAITGASETPVYLYIKDGGECEIRDASHLWGKTTYETEDALISELGDKRVRVAAIGPAGENLVKFASLMAGRHNHAARGGPGAVLGSKKLKAIAVRAKNKRTPANPDLYKQSRDRIKVILETDVTVKAFHDFGTDGTMQLGMMVTDVPTKNWRVADWTDGSEKLNGVYMADTILSARKSCAACIVGCKRVVTVKDGPHKCENEIGPEYETCASMGTLILNDDLGVVTAANRLCNELGLDTISAGSTVAFAMEAYEKGLITDADTGGLKLKWGDTSAAMELLRKISARSDVGGLLAEGTKRAAEKLGRGAIEFAIQSKGLELPMHDPRAYHSLALAYAMSNRGACHTKHMNIVIEMGAYKYPEFGVKGPYNPLSRDNKATLTIGSEDMGTVVSSLVMCMFTSYALQASDFCEMIEAFEGSKFTPETLLQAAHRIWMVLRSFNLLCGFGAADDTLPKRVLSPHEEGQISGLDKVVFNITKTQLPHNVNLRRQMLKTYDYILPRQAKLVRLIGKLMFFQKLKGKAAVAKGSPDLEFMKKEYYSLRGLDSRGVPTKSRLEELGLADLAPSIGAN